MPVISFGVSIVVFQPDLDLLARTLFTLGRAIRFTQGRLPLDARLWIVDNTPPSRGMARQIDEAASKPLSTMPDVVAETIRGHGNVGYGRGHNLAIARSMADYHLVLNPDVELDEDALFEALQYMQTDVHTGLLAPEARDAKGESLHLCKTYPTVLDLLVRGFAPLPLAALFRARIARYELRELVARGMPAQVPLASGCFMLFRKPILERLGGFAPGYFLYFEDYDASLRAGRISKVTYVPSVRIVHHGGNAARKGLRHVRLFCASALRFYRTHGWKVV
jgi:GT2 family glycosyltransferase